MHPAFWISLKQTIETAREKNIQVIYVVVGFRKGYPEVSAVNKSFTALRNSGRNLNTEEGMKIETTIAPQPGEIVLRKEE